MKIMNGEKITVVRVEGDKRAFLPLLLVGDESERMIDGYLERGELFAAYCGEDPVAVCVVVDLADGLVEVKNLAVDGRWRRRGIGRMMLRYVETLFPGLTIQLGTGEVPSTMLFYQSCGYEVSHRIPDFFILNYDEPIVEDGIQLKDMVYLKKKV